MAALDSAVGWRDRQVEPPALDFNAAAAVPVSAADAAGGPEPPPRLIRLLLAAREPHGGHSRVIVNQAALLQRCEGSSFAVERPGRTLVRLQCRLLPAGANATTQVRFLQWADVYVTMWGGDTINALHMRRGGVVIEMVRPPDFERRRLRSCFCRI